MQSIEAYPITDKFDIGRHSFETINELALAYNQALANVIDVKNDYKHLVACYNRVPCVHKLREIKKAIKQNRYLLTLLKQGELPTKALAHGFEHQETLKAMYLEQLKTVIGRLEDEQKRIEATIRKDKKALAIETDMLILKLALKQARADKNAKGRALKRYVNVGNRGIAYWNEDKTKFLNFSIRLEA